MVVKGMTEEELGVWGERVSAAVDKALIVHMTNARL
jgi:hypothetical protein